MENKKTFLSSFNEKLTITEDLVKIECKDLLDEKKIQEDKQKNIERKVKNFERFHKVQVEAGSCLWNSIAKVHNNKFKEYCNQLVTDTLHLQTQLLIQKLFCYQERSLKERNNYFKRRYVLGLKETLRELYRYKLNPNIKKIVAVILPIDISIENSQEELREQVELTLESCYQNKVFVVFAFNRRNLGRLLKINLRISALTIRDIGGVEEEYKQLTKTVKTLKELYRTQIFAHFQNCNGDDCVLSSLSIKRIYDKVN